MYLYISLIIEVITALTILSLLWVILMRARSNKIVKIRDVPLTCEELEDHAAKIAIEHSVGRRRSLLNWPIPRMNENYDFILSVYKRLNEDVMKKHSISPAAEWLLDNFYIIEEQVKGIRKTLKKADYFRLPILKCGQLKGCVRIYAVAVELISHTDGQINEDILYRYLKAYQSHCTLFNREILALPLMIRLALIENIRNICEKIRDTQVQWRKADEAVDSWMGNDKFDPDRMLRSIKGKFRTIDEANPSFIEHLFYRIRRAGRGYHQISRYIEESLRKYGTTIEDVTQKEHNAQAVSAVTIGNCIISLKFISTSDWIDIFESTSSVEQILRQDPDGTYPAMDLASRNYYRARIEELASVYGVSELHVASEAVALAGSAAPEDRRARHIGYYLIGKGSRSLEDSLGKRLKSLTGAADIVKNYPHVLFLGSIGLITILLAAAGALYALYASPATHILLAVLAGIAVIVPSSEIAIGVVNWVICNVQKPAVFPRLELKGGIPESLSTIVVMPVLIPEEKRVEELIENLEGHYLANKEENLYFALVGDFKDSASRSMKDDDRIVEAALRGINELNRKYSRGGYDLFHYFHRQRIFNEKHGRWMGWERKRGALLEFNDLLLGLNDTGFAYSSDTSLPVAKIKFVITLDADTIMPIGTAKKMIGTIAHPLNRPVVDRRAGIVTEGYGIIQPRISFGIESSNRSLFSRIYTGQRGIDPYACAVSDVYQDLFGEGIFTGKGIYDLTVFQGVLKNTVPENTILSHDLLEGSYVRTGLATDLELIDSYPSRYNSFIARLHRWVRGDWQLVPWLCATVCDRNGNRVRNPLSLLSRWKIIDNLRRSLVSPALVALIILGFSVLPGSSLIWSGFALVAVAFPAITAMVDYLLSKRIATKRLKRYIPAISALQAVFLQVLLSFIFLPYQAYMMAHAIALTLARIFITKRNMLEWVTAADIEKGQRNSLTSYWGKMYISLLIAVITAVLAFALKPAFAFYSLVLIPIWGISPFVAYRISKTTEDVPYRLSREDARELRRISRKIWRYFEEHANFKNHYLAPDNYQEDPPRGIAYRTSPTNIGLGLLAALTARDLGYVGLYEMTEMVSNTVSTIEKMEKWNGHLYNWYDTRTLRPLRPRYISTVDSGNLVCYLITLAKGLEDYLGRPLVDEGFVEGIKDTFGLIGSEGADILSAAGLLNESGSEKTSDLIEWGRTLSRLLQSCRSFNIKKSPWKAKSERMVKMLKNELGEFMPWIGIVEAFPQQLNSDFPDGGVAEAVSGILKSLKDNIPIKSMPSAYENIEERIGETLESVRKIQGGDRSIVLNWLESLRGEVLKAAGNARGFISRYTELIERIRAIADAIEFKSLYVENKQLFSIGYNIEESRLTNSYYDLLASEARQTSYIAIARGEVPPKHWFKMGRSLTVVDGYKGLVSWTGTMFEYIMPLLIMKSYRNTLLDETYSFVIRSQKKYGAQRGIPWGVSESGFYSLDINLDYQYKAIGVPWLGLKRGLVEDAVVAPYATFLALIIDPAGAVENIKALKAEGLDGPYGFYEAVDYTPDRLPFGVKRAVIKSFMAHHQGMSLLSLNNYLNENIMQKRFHADPVVKAAQLLLQEKIPANILYTKETKEKIIPFKDVVYKERGPVRRFRMPDPVLPKAHILSNGSYTVLITDKGTGYSKNKMVTATRWREEAILDYYGMFFYIRNADTNLVWSATHAPLNTLPEKYEVIFTSDKARFKRWDGDVETETEIVVASGDNAEIRRVTLKNHGETAYVLEITSYFEVVLAPQAADVAHPVFSNLFVKTEFLPEKRCIVANRRPRSEMDRNFWIANTAVVEGETIGDVQFETDRAQFLGRGHNVTAPIAVSHNKPLSNTAGPVLDPVMCLRQRVRVEPGKKAVISYIVAVSESNEALLELIEKYMNPEAVESAFRLALTRSQVEARYLNIKAPEIELYQDLISHILYISPQRRLNLDIISRNTKGQSSLWPYGISGDLPVVLVILHKPDEIDLLYDILKAHEYWQLKDLKVDLVILNDEENSYTHPFGALLYDIITSSHAHDIMNKPGGVFILNRSNIPAEDISLLYAAARIVLKGDSGALADQVKKVQADQLPKIRKFNGGTREYGLPRHKEIELDYFNGIGGFSPDGKEYVVRLEKDQNTPMPWINVISNPHFGFIVSESGSGYTWYENSRENKLTPWSNDPVSDSPGEVIYIDDSDTGELWTITPLPIRESEPYIIRHGFGYSVFEHTSHGIEQSMVQYVPVDEPVKISIIKLKNVSRYARNITLTYYIRPVLGVNEQSAAMHIRTRLGDSGALLLENPYNEEFPGRIAFMDVSEKERFVTGDRREFFGAGGLSSPEALKRQKLSGTLGTGYDPCAAMQTSISFEENEEKKVVFMLGMDTSLQAIDNCIKRYREIKNAEESLIRVSDFWREKLEIVQVNTPDHSMNIMLNGWLFYQVVSCRLWARTAFYQAGGAFGFRDQLQDCLSVAQFWPEITREQILKHAGHQFIEGDVQHWWHEPAGKGTRTRFSDDLLWLPYAVSEYVRITGDYGILDAGQTFLEDEPLKEFEDERYGRPVASAVSSSIYDHCIRTIEKALKFGDHGLPLMGSGDWNDGMNTVGNRGRGESVWIGWFLYAVLVGFSPLCSWKGEEERSGKYLEIASGIANAIEKNAWDGNWYRRAYFDNGMPLGSVINSECKIDSIAQTWAVISGAGNPRRTVEAMNSVENYLVQREDGLIKLLAPPFDEGDLEPGYIKGYVPGVRENGGQYTHAAAWVIIANALLGDGDRAWELFELINPINHARTHIEYSKYKVEPYVMAADVYAVYPHIGRGGWTWYTGSAGWIYRAGLEYILGFRRNGGTLAVDPCIPQKWTEYEIWYRYLETRYVIRIKNPEGVSRGVKKVSIDGKVSDDNLIRLENDRVTHQVEVCLGK